MDLTQTNNALIRLRRGTAEEWTAANPTLKLGEPGFETDTFKLKIGDGKAAWSVLPYIVNEALIQQAVTEYLNTHPISGGINYQQSTPSATWIIPHGFGRIPNVQIVISGQKVETDIDYGLTSVTINFPIPYSGIAVLT